jgi:hypothetical protein
MNKQTEEKLNSQAQDLSKYLHDFKGHVDRIKTILIDYEKKLADLNSELEFIKKAGVEELNTLQKIKIELKLKKEESFYDDVFKVLSFFAFIFCTYICIKTFWGK